MNKKQLRLTYDYNPDSDSAYIYFGTIKPTEIIQTAMLDETLDFVQGDINLDFDARGQLRGIEILNVSKVLPTDLLN